MVYTFQKYQIANGMLSTSDLDEKHRRLWENTILTIVIDTLTMKSKKKTYQIKDINGKENDGAKRKI